MIDTVLALAGRGWAILPCYPGSKHPASRHGVHDATTDPDRLREWWTRHPADNPALACGASRLLVLDVDNDKSLAALGEPMPDTYTVTTPRGRHLYFAAPEYRVPNSVGMVGHGLDVRSAGGFVVAAGAVVDHTRYRTARDAPVAPAPSWLLERATPRPRPTRPPMPVADHDRYVAAALEGEARKVAKSFEGERNDTLNRAAYKLARYVARGWLDALEVERVLTNAAAYAGLDVRETRSTIASGLRAGACVCDAESAL